MGDDFSSMFERPYRPLADMSEADKDAELERWRNLWTWIPADIQSWLTKIGQRVRFVRRDYKSIEGTLGVLDFDLKSVEVEVIERIYNYSKGEATYETKTVVLPLGSIMDYEFIYNEEVRDETIDGLERQAGEPILE